MHDGELTANVASRLMGSCAVALIGCLVAGGGLAAEAVQFDEAFVLAELNDIEGDLGFHAKVAGDAWQYLEIKGSKGGQLLSVTNKGNLRRQGLTELFFESAEPTFDELTPSSSQVWRKMPRTRSRS